MPRAYRKLEPSASEQLRQLLGEPWPFPGRPPKHDLSTWTVTDDWPERVPVTYLHSTVSTRDQRVRVPETPMHLDALLADEPLAGGLEPRLGTAHLRTLTVVGFPTSTHPGILDELNRLAFPYHCAI